MLLSNSIVSGSVLIRTKLNYMTADNPWTWYYKFGSVLGVLLLAYFFLHTCWKGEEMVNLSTQEMADVQTIVNRSGLDTIYRTGSVSGGFAHRDTLLGQINRYIYSRYDLSDRIKHRQFMTSYTDLCRLGNQWAAGKRQPQVVFRCKRQLFLERSNFVSHLSFNS